MSAINQRARLPSRSIDLAKAVGVEPNSLGELNSTRQVRAFASLNSARVRLPTFTSDRYHSILCAGRLDWRAELEFELTNICLRACLAETKALVGREATCERDGETKSETE